MALSGDIIQSLARELDQSEKARKQIGQFSLRYPEITFADAYAIQNAWVAMKIAAGDPQIGRKIGLTSRAMQRASDITEPDYGVLLKSMVFEDNGDIPVTRFITPRVEVELAFILSRDLSGPDCTVTDVLRVTDFVVPAIEIIDLRIEGVDPKTGIGRKVFDTIADNAANAGIVLGGSPFRADAVDLRWAGALIHRNGVIEDSGLAGAVLGHPARGVAWLANKLHPHGEKLKAGEIILGGSFTAPVPARAGDSFHVDFGSLGSISVRFTETER